MATLDISSLTASRSPKSDSRFPSIGESEKKRKTEITYTARKAIDTEPKRDSPPTPVLSSRASVRGSDVFLKVPSPISLDGSDSKLEEEKAKFKRMQQLFKKTRNQNKDLKERYRKLEKENEELNRKVRSLNKLLERGEILFQKEIDNLTLECRNLRLKSQALSRLKRIENSDASDIET